MTRWGQVRGNFESGYRSSRGTYFFNHGEAYPRVENLKGVPHSAGSGLICKIRKGWKGLPRTNSFIIHAPDSLIRYPSKDPGERNMGTNIIMQHDLMIKNDFSAWTRKFDFQGR
jgi:hypothetical protein